MVNRFCWVFFAAISLSLKQIGVSLVVVAMTTARTQAGGTFAFHDIDWLYFIWSGAGGDLKTFDCSTK